MSSPKYETEFDKLRRRLNDGWQWNDDLPAIAYHYTSTASFLSILRSGCLWGTDYRCLNDPTEFRIVRGPFRRGIEDLPADGPRGLLRQAALAILDGEDGDGGWDDQFVVSFSHDADSLSQWRAYGDDGQGVAIGFDLRAFPEGPLGPPPWSKTVALAVEYETAKVDKVVEELLDTHVDLYERLIGNLQVSLDQGLSHEEANDAARVLVTKTIQSLFVTQAILNLRFKHHGYAEENESRLVAGRPRKEGPTGPLRFRSVDGMPTAYVEFRMGQEGDGMPLPIKTFTVGPRLDFARARLALESALEQHGYTDVKVTQSEKQYRR